MSERKLRERITPGEWKVAYGRNGFGKRGKDVVTSIGPICSDHNHWDGYYLSVSDDDAELIAKAPELLSSHEQLLGLVQKSILQVEYLHDKFKETGSGNALLDQLRAALAEAEKLQ